MLKCMLSPITRPVRSLARRIHKPAKTPLRPGANDIFEGGGGRVQLPKTSQIYLVSDPFTRKETAITTKPVRDLDAIFNEGWDRLATANTVETKRQALNGIMYGLSLNGNNECCGISRAAVERLRSGKQARMQDYAYLNGSLGHALDSTETEMGLYSKRPDKIAELPAADWANATEANVFKSVNSYSGTLRAKVKKVFDALERSFLEEYSVNQQGVRKAQSLQDIENAMQNAGDGAIGYIFPDSHILPVVNVKGDVFALPNFFDSSPCAEHMSSGAALGVSPPHYLKYAITKHKLLRPNAFSIA